MSSYSITSSPKYLEMKQILEEHREELEQEKITRHRFLQEHIIPLDENVNMPNAMMWVGANLQKTKDKVVNLIESHFLQNYDKMSNTERMEAVDKMQSEIRYFSKKLFHAKIYEFIENPDRANKLKFSELQKLYRMIREEESREKEIALKHQDSKRKDIFGLFAIMSLAKTFTPEELDKVEQLVIKRRDGEHQLQQSGGASDTGDTEGTTTNVPGPVESPGMG